MSVAHCIAWQVADKEHWDLVELSLSPDGKYQIDFCMRDHSKLSRHSDNGTYQLVPFGYLSHLQVTLLALAVPHCTLPHCTLLALTNAVLCKHYDATDSGNLTNAMRRPCESLA